MRYPCQIYATAFLLASAAASFAALEIETSELTPGPGIRVVCRHPLDFTPGSEKGTVQLDFGETKRSLKVKEILKVQDGTTGVLLEWPQFPLRKGEGTSPFTVNVPATILPPAAVKAILDGKRTRPDGRPFLPEISAGGERFLLPSPPGFYRWDKRNRNIDELATHSLQGSGYRMLAMLGLEGSEQDIRSGTVPGRRTVIIKCPGRLEDVEMQRGSFSAVKANLRKSREKAEQTRPDFLGDMEAKVNNEAETRFQVKPNIQISELEFLDIFAEDDSSILHSVMIHSNGMLGGEPKQVRDVTSTCLMEIRARYIEIEVTSRYKSEEDRQWAEKTCLLFRDQLRELNPKRKFLDD